MAQVKEASRGTRRVLSGKVLSNKMDKTVTVLVETTMKHPVYGKVIKRGKKFHAHDESNALQLGENVKIVESRPISKLKKWRVI